MSTVIRTFGTVACLAASITAAAGIAADSRPTIVLFHADDLGYGELGCYGNTAAITPNLDRFAAEGLRLADCHSACPVCSPSRAALLTGRHPYRTGVFTRIPEGSPIQLRASEVTLPETLRADVLAMGRVRRAP